MARLTRIEWPDFGAPDVPPEPALSEYRERLSAVRTAMAARGQTALVVYGDREHVANLHWLTGFDPRFEEAVMVITAADAVLIAGNECLAYTGVSPLVAAGDVQPVLCATLSLPSQPRGGARIADLLAQAIPAGARVGAAGWKWFSGEECDDPTVTLDLPAFLADPLRAHAGRVENATDLFMHPGHGLRARVDAAGIARLEFANHMAAAALRRMAFALREGMTDFDCVQAAGVGGLPLSCHMTFATGSRADMGLSGPTGQVLRAGSPISFNIAHWGSNICRAGWLARGSDDLPEAARDYAAAFVFPYVAAMSGWCALMRPGVTGGQVWAAMQETLPFDQFGVFLNPGHLIGLDEWMSSPIAEGSSEPLASGMAMQMDVIPGHPVYGSTRMEDGYVVADDALRADLAARFPAVAARCAARAAFMREVIGMRVPDSLLPLADTCGIVAPWMLDPGLVVTLR
ncbi:MAG: aminopeptidase P family N-terminal domain-containing protein [Paracoccaceae bacterium]|nr:MAG: aminopeptidase P family N-terminal domain-containing protein [Paracoccaceae bacterium]